MKSKIAFRFFLLLLFSTSLFARHPHGRFINGIVDTEEELNYVQRAVFFDSLTTRPLSDTYADSPSNIFRVHWLSDGPNAPDPTDLNSNNIPDYVDSVLYYADQVYDLYINQIGYKSPYPEPRISQHYDIYLWDLGDSDDDTNSEEYDPGGLYGFTLPTEQIDNGQPGSVARFSYMVIDNDFSPTDSVREIGERPRRAYTETGIRAMKITVAHEFHHGVQCMYDTRFSGWGLFSEMTSTAMEKRFLSDSEDYFQYVRAMFSDLQFYPFSVDSPTNGYAYSLFGQYLEERFAESEGTPNDFPLLNTWELIFSENFNGFQALDSTLVFMGSDLATEFCEFVDWAYHTGERAYLKEDGFSNATDIPQMGFFSVENFSDNTFGTGNLANFEINPRRVYFPSSSEEESPDTLDFIMVQVDRESVKRRVSTQAFFTYDVDKNIGSQFIEEIGCYLTLDSQSEHVCSHIYPYSGVRVVNIDFSYPNPFNPENNQIITFPAPSKGFSSEKVLLTIYSADMMPIYNEQLNVSVDSQLNSVVVLDDVPQLSSGVYIFTVDGTDERKIGKFSVVRN